MKYLFADLAKLLNYILHIEALDIYNNRFSLASELSQLIFLPHVKKYLIIYIKLIMNQLLVERLQQMREYKGIKAFLIRYFTADEHFDCEHEGIKFILTKSGLIASNLLRMRTLTRDTIARYILEEINLFDYDQRRSSYEIFKATNLNKLEPEFAVISLPYSLTDFMVLNYDYIKKVTFHLIDVKIIMRDVNVVNGMLIPKAIFRNLLTNKDYYTYDDVDFSKVVFVTGWNDIIPKCPNLRRFICSSNFATAEEMYNAEFANIITTKMPKSSRKVLEL